MTRKELIEKAAAERAAVATEDKGLRYLDFVNTAEWADRTMLARICEWLENHDMTEHNRVFYFFNKEIADSISKEGQKLIREIYFKKEGDDTER